MKLVIKGKDDRKPVVLTLEKCPVNEDIILKADGLGGNLLFIKQNGRIERCSCIEESLGFDLDEKGRIKIDD